MLFLKIKTLSYTKTTSKLSVLKGQKEDREIELEVGDGDGVRDRDEDGVGDGKKMEMEVGLEIEMKLEMEKQTDGDGEEKGNQKKFSHFSLQFLAGRVLPPPTPRMGALPASLQYGHLRQSKVTIQKTSKGPELHGSKKSLFGKINTCCFFAVQPKHSITW